MKRSLCLLFCLSLTVFVLACGDDDEDGTPTPAPSPTTAAPTAPAPTATPEPTTTPPAPGSPDPPTGLRIEGALPDLRTPVPPGEGELGRITLIWQDNSDDESGFRVYQDCNGSPEVLLEVEADTEQIGPVQACRPGRVGVAAFNAAGESEIAWSS